MLDGPKCTFRHSSLECGPTAFCWRGVCRDTIFERTCELYKCTPTDDGWTWWDLTSQSQNSKPGFACDRDINNIKCSDQGKNVHGNYTKNLFCAFFYFVSYNVTFIFLFSFLEICTADKDCFGVYKYCDLGICVKGERPLVRDSQR